MNNKQVEEIVRTAQKTDWFTRKKKNITWASRAVDRSERKRLKKSQYGLR